MKVDPNGKVIRITDPELFDYPFVFLSNVNEMILSDPETEILRKYLLNGGFMMADDFWAPRAWQHVYSQMKRVFPDLEPRELSPDHEIFHIVYDLKGTPQVPSIRAWQRGDAFECEDEAEHVVEHLFDVGFEGEVATDRFVESGQRGSQLLSSCHRAG